ncbi:MAG: S9 family peptidase [Sphingomicrobium sp.]
MRRFGFLAFAAIAAICANAPLAAAPLPDAVPIETFAMLPEVEGAQLSPDGTKIAAKFAIKGRMTLVVMSLAGGGQPALLQAGKVDVNWWRWVGNDWLTIGLGAEQTIGNEEMYITRTLGARSDFKTINKLDWARSGQLADNVIWAARDGAPRILLSKQTGFDTEEQWLPSVHEFDLSTGKSKQVTGPKPDVFEWFADPAGNVRLGSGYDQSNKRFFYLYRSAEGGSFTTIQSSRTNENSTTSPAIFRADGSAITLDDRDGRYEVYELALPSFTLGRKIFAVPAYDTGTLYLNAAGNDLIGVGLTEKKYRVTWFDPAMKQLQGDLDALAPPGEARIIDWSDDLKTTLVRVGGASQAGGLFVWAPAQRQARLVSWNNDILKDRKLSPVSTVNFSARDGTPIEAVLTLPRGRQAKNLPFIVMPHGGPFARDDESFDWWAQYLAEQGYAVIQPNYRGSSGYGRDFSALGEGQWGLKMQDDLNDALAWAVAQGIADPRRACMVGASYGGYAAMRAAQRDGSLYRCAISYAGVSDLAAMTRYDGQFLLGDVRKKWLRKQAPDFKQVSPRFGASSFSVPILIAHGAEDKRVPVKQSRLMVGELKKAGKPHEYLEQPEGDHHFSRGQDRLEFLKAMKAFLDKHNPA